MAYFMLPQLLAQDEASTLQRFIPGRPGGASLYVLACVMQGIDPDEAALASFHIHVGVRAPSGLEYHVLEYPTPPPLDLEGLDLDAIVRSEVVLAPFYSAIVRVPGRAGLGYYILGQRPFGGTTLRMVEPGGVNANLGEGPEPTLAAFLAALDERITRR